MRVRDANYHLWTTLALGLKICIQKAYLNDKVSWIGQVVGTDVELVKFCQFVGEDDHC